MFEAFTQGLIQIFQPAVFLAMLLGVVVAIVVGILPGLGGPAIIIMSLPFIIGQDPLTCLAFLTVLQCVNTTSGSITSILIGVPGESSNAADVLDGYPMTRRGEGARAIGAALTSSMLGGSVSVLFAFLMIPFIMPLLGNFKSAELFASILLAMCFLAVLTQGAATKGFISAGIGILLSCIGFQAKTGAERFTFGNPYLYDGIQTVVVLMGLLALPVLAELVGSNESIDQSGANTTKSYFATLRQMGRGALDVVKHWWLWLRCTIIGYVVGVLPAGGSETAVWVAYAHAKQTSKHPETFGTGNIEGLIAPQSATNARAGGSMLTTLALGIPSGPSMVLILAAFVLLGIQPGPRMLSEHTELSFSLLSIIAVSNILAAVLCVVALPVCIKITRVPAAYLFCLIMPLIYIGTYVYKQLFIDLILMLVVTAIGMLLRRFSYSIPSVIFGFIMGRLFEYYLWQAVDFNGPLFFLTPVSMTMLALCLIILTKSFWASMWKKRGIAAINIAGSTSISIDNKGEIWFLLGIMVVALAFGLGSFTYPDLKTRLVPAASSLLVFVLASIQLKNELSRKRKTDAASHDLEAAAVDSGKQARAWRPDLVAFAWLLAYTAAIYLVGFLAGTLLLVLCFLKANGYSWLKSAMLAVVATAAIYGVFVKTLEADLFQGVIVTAFSDNIN